MRNMRPGVPRRHADAPDLVAAVGRLARASLLVVGDAMLDRYVYGRLQHCATEPMYPLLEVERELALPGGAANLVRQLTALGASVSFVSVVGDDQTGSDLTGLIGGQPGVEPWLLVEGGRTTTQRTRFLAEGQPMLRADQAETAPIPSKLGERLLRFARDAMMATAVTVLSDHGKGVLGGEMPERMIEAARQIGRPVVAVPRAGDPGRYAGADVLVVSPPPGSETAAADGIAELRERHHVGAAVVLGPATLVLADDNGVLTLPAEPAAAARNAGAGYPEIAALAAGLAAGLGLRVATRLAAVAAEVTAGKSGTDAVVDSDLLQALAI